MLTIDADEHTRMVLLTEEHAQSIFEMVDSNRNHLRTWLPFVDNMQTVTFAETFVHGSIYRNNMGNEYAFVIMHKDTMVGRIAIYKIDARNQTGEIGYWIIEQAQGKGIMTICCSALLDFCFNNLQLNRIEIRCGTGNLKSKAIPERLGFRHEGILRQAELLYDQFIDLHLFSLVKTDYQP